MIPGSLDLEGVMQDLVLFRVALVKVEERVLAIDVRHDEEVEMERVVPDHEAMHREAFQDLGLLGRFDAERVLHRFDVREQMRV